MRLPKRWDPRKRAATPAAAAPDAAATAVVEPLVDPYGFDGTTEELRAEIDRIQAGPRTRETEREALKLRHLLGVRQIDEADPNPQYAVPDNDNLPDGGSGLPEIDAKDVTPELIRAGILRDGCLLIRGLFPREDALAMAELIDRAFEEREKHDKFEPSAEGFYEEFMPHPRYGPVNARPWIKEGGGVLGADSPMGIWQMMDLFNAAGVPALASGYLGEPTPYSVHKTTLRKATPDVPGAWHQDGAFLGRVRALNLWVSLSRCGDESPGLDLVPTRIEEFVKAQTDDAILDYQVSQKKAEETANADGKTILRPIFEPGDALFFDEFFLHQTGSDPAMPKPRYAIENWFFGASAFPQGYAPIAP